MSVALEATVVGVALALAFVVWVRVVGPVRTARDAALAGLVLGVLFHLACEAGGVNRWYCVSGAACAR